MKIVLATGIYPPETGGPATFVPAFARELQRRGYGVTVVTYGTEQTHRDGGWDVSVVSRFGGPVLRYLRYAWRTFLEARRADLIFLQGPVSEGLRNAGRIFCAQTDRHAYRRRCGGKRTNEWSGLAGEPLDTFDKTHSGRSFL